jgi:hypothetical protein
MVCGMCTGSRLPAALLFVCASLVFVGQPVYAQQPLDGSTSAGPFVAERAYQNLFRADLRLDPPRSSSIFASARFAARSTANETSEPVAAPARHVFSTLYAGLVATQALDIHSTLRALDAGHREANPLARWATSNPLTLVAFKTATTAGTVFIIERLRKKHPKRALLLLAAVDSAYALVVAHNYSVPMPTR